MATFATFGILAASVLVGWLIARLLRNKCSTAIRVVLGIVGGFCCLFLFGIIALVWTISHIKPPETFNAETYKGTTGSISLPYKCKVELNLRKADEQGEYRSKWYKGENGSVIVPPGNYHLMYYSLTTNDENGNPSCEYSGNGFSSPPKITVAAGQTQELKVGPPFNAWIDVKQKKNRIYMDFNMTGCNQEKCSVQTGDGQAPGFQILSQSGEILQTGSFEYG